MPDFIAALDREIAELDAELRAHPAYMKLEQLRGVRALYAAAGNMVQRTVNIKSTSHVSAAATVQRRVPTSGVSLEVLAAVRDFLRGRPYPTPTREIMTMLGERGIHVGGSNPQNAVSSLMSKAPDLRANGRAGWVLVETKLADDNAPRQDVSPAINERQDDFLTEPHAQGREAVPGGGT